MNALLDTAIKTYDTNLAERVVKYVGNVNYKSGGCHPCIGRLTLVNSRSSSCCWMEEIKLGCHKFLL